MSRRPGLWLGARALSVGRRPRIRLRTVTPDAILLNHLCPRLVNADRGRIHPQGGHQGVTDAVRANRIESADSPTMGFVTVRAGRHLAMIAQSEGILFRPHQVAFHATCSGIGGCCAS